jgi:hypothetical protein
MKDRNKEREKRNENLPAFYHEDEGSSRVWTFFEYYD